ncbi:signal peptidase I [Eubacteriales bacterium KG125]
MDSNKEITMEEQEIEKTEPSADSGKEKSASKRSEIKEWIKSIIIAGFIAVVLMQFIVPTVVRERSMEPSFYGGDYLIVSKISYKISSPKRGDVVIFKSEIPLSQDEPGGKKKLLIKRVIGVPGDLVDIADGTVSINGKVIDEPYINKGGTPGDVKGYKVPEGNYFVMGDNRSVSIDSRRHEVGPVNGSKIVGKAIFRVYPFNKIGLL